MEKGCKVGREERRRRKGNVKQEERKGGEGSEM